MKSNLKHIFQPILVISALLISTVYFCYVMYATKQSYPTFELMQPATKRVVGAFFLALVTIIASYVWLTARDIARLRGTQDWLIDAVNWNIERLKTHGLCRRPEKTEDSLENGNELRWPWGSHHTETLGHLEAAAKRFWILYAPGRNDTAPTNDMVATWLQNERGISREKARAIASMLRPDGLPTGPRK